MRKIILLQICLCSFMVLQAQNEFHYFNRVYESDSNGISTIAVESFENNYMLLGGFNWYDGYSAIYTRTVNNIGESIDVDIIDYGQYFSVALFGNSLAQDNEGNFLAACQKGVTAEETDYLLIKFSSTGEVLWSREYEHAGRENHAQVVVCEEGGYLLVGVTVTGNSYQTYLIRTDDFGEVMWEREIGDVAIPLYAEQTQDNGFIISGYHFNTTTGYDMYVLKTDAEGMVEWENTYGTDENDHGCFVTQLPNEQYVLLGAVKYPADNHNTYFARLDVAGNVLWSKEYDFNQYCGHSGRPILTENNDILIVVYEYSNTDIRELHFTKFSSENGEIIWQKPIGSGISSEDYIRDIEPTADGGYILSGFNLTSPQRSWVVKTDALGNTCGLAPCDSTIIQLIDTGTYINNTIDKAFPLSIRPNPVIDRCFIDYELSAKYPFAVLELYNLKGEQVHHTFLSSHETTAQMDIAHLASGIYLYKILNIDGVLASGKLVKE